eukprot:2040548-Amphidinium_carterae.1
MEACNTKPCDPNQDCEFADWSEWSECTRKCGGGQRNKTRRSSCCMHRAPPDKETGWVECITEKIPELTCKCQRAVCPRKSASENSPLHS